MNLFLFLNKYGNKSFYFDFIIKINNKEFKLKIYKNGKITNYNYNKLTQPRIFNFKKILFKYNQVNLSSALPIIVDKKINKNIITIYVPKSKHNVMIFNRLLKRKLLLKDIRFKKKSIFDIYNSFIHLI